jgi:two-component system, OmpR family, response regulator VanR
MAKETILIVDDEKEIRDLIHIYLINEGFNTIRVNNGIEALELLKKNDVHLIILDIMMPGMDGVQTCLKIREENNMPIIFLSAKTQDIDKITGLSSGADDYVIKPFNPLELVARVKSQLRRYMQLNSKTYHRDNVFEIDDLVVDGESHEVFVTG